MICTCMVLNTILYMDCDVKHKTIEQLLLSLHTKTSVSLGISSPSPSLCIMHINLYTFMMSYIKGHHINDHVHMYYMYMCTNCTHHVVCVG